MARADGARARSPVQASLGAGSAAAVEAVARIPASIPLDETEICCDVDRHVFNAAHTHPAVTEALTDTHWYEVHEWATSGPGADAHAA